MNAFSRALDELGSREFQLSAENPVPEPTCYTKSVLEISKMMLKMILLELAVIGRQTA